MTLCKYKFIIFFLASVSFSRYRVFSLFVVVVVFLNPQISKSVTSS